MKRKKPYLPNNWKEYKEAPEEWFENHTFDELMDWKVAGWELPSSVHAIIRITDLKTKKVTEKTYQTHTGAQRKVDKLLNTKGIEFTVCDPVSIHHLNPELSKENE